MSPLNSFHVQNI